MEELKNGNGSIGNWFHMSGEELASVTADRAKKESERYSGFTNAMSEIVKSANNGKTVALIGGVTESDLSKIKELGYDVTEQRYQDFAPKYCHVSKTFMVKW